MKYCWCQHCCFRDCSVTFSKLQKLSSQKHGQCLHMLVLLFYGSDKIYFVSLLVVFVLLNLLSMEILTTLIFICDRNWREKNNSSSKVAPADFQLLIYICFLKRKYFFSSHWACHNPGKEHIV